jgi:Peptidase family S41
MIVSSMSRRAVLGSFSAAIAPHALFARTTPGAPLLRPTDMRADVALLRRAYGALHPGLLRYNSAAKMEGRFDALEAALAAPMSLRTFYLTLSRALATVRCGHTYANFYNQRSEVAAALFEAPDRLPFDFLWLGNAMIVTADPFAIGIKPGSRIVAIDGRQACAVLAALLPFARADGHNDAKRRRLLSVQGDDRYETFDIFFSLLFGRERYRLVVDDPDGRRRTTTVAAVTLAQRRASAHAGVDVRGDKPVWTIERRGDAALLSMPNWGLYDSQWDWRGWLNQAIDRLVIERVPRLVVDLRANEGGLDCGNALAERLVMRPTAFEEVQRLVRYRTVPEDLKPVLDTWDRSFDHLGENATRVDDRFYRLDATGDRVDPISPRGTRYEGDVRILIGPQNSSATFQFADFVRRNGLATLIGEPTGGNRRGINGGCFYFLRLPATGLEADLPLIGRFPTTPQPDRGVVPDIPLPLSRADLISGTDRQLRFALA